MKHKFIAATINNTMLIKTEKDLIDSHFINRKLNVDYINAFSIFFYYARVKILDKLQPIELYVNYFLKFYPNASSYIMQKSDSAALEKLNACVGQYNSELEKMKITKDYKGIMTMLNQILLLTKVSASE